MSSSNDVSETTDSGPRLRMKPALNRIFCCSVTAASGFIAAYALVAYSIALIYEIVWVVEARGGLPIPSALLMVCYAVVMAATTCLVHGLISKNNNLLLAWLIAVILVLIPECALVFYMSINHWGLQGVYGGAELACYVARLPALVIGVVLVQSAYALREARKAGLSHAAALGSGSEFDASHFVPDAPAAFSNDGFLPDTGKSGSMPDLRRLPFRRAPPAYWQQVSERALAASLRGPPKMFPPHIAMYGTWLGPRTGPYDNPYKRRHSVVGAFNDEYPTEFDDRNDCKSELAYPYYRHYDPRMYPPEYDPRFYHDFKHEEEAYGVNLLRHDPYHFNTRERVFYDLRNSHTSVGNESDDLTKYKDVAL